MRLDPRENIWHVYPSMEEDLHDIESGTDPAELCACDPTVSPVLNGTNSDATVVGFMISHNDGVLVRVGVNGHSRIERYMF